MTGDGAVRRLTYVLQFHRPPRSGSQDGLATAPGLVVSTHVADGTVTSELTPLAGAPATLDLTYTLNQDGSQFFEWGSIQFGDAAASTLSFASVGAGALLGPPDADGFSHGTVMYAVQGGTGALEGAGGAITSNFLVDLATDELLDTHLGIVRLP